LWKLNVAVIRPKFPGSPSPEVKQGCFRPIDAAEARALLAELAAELLAGVFPYLLPCEGVFTWWKRRGKDNELTVREAVLLLRDDNFTRLSSDRGPIADARRYPVPATADADDIVARRFQPYFDGFGATS